MIDRLLQGVPARTIYIAMAATIGLVLLASYLYLFKKPWAEYVKLKRSRILLEAKTETEALVKENIVALQKKLNTLEHQLRGDTPPLPVNSLVAHTIATLDTISMNHDVQLSSLKPGAVQTLYDFEEVPFSVKVEGNYFGLHRWLYAVESELGPMVVKRFTLKNKDREKVIEMDMEMASYRPVEDK